jgi:hypothetical protein
VRATTATTIRGVSILTGRRGAPAEVFDIALSTNGIEIRRPGLAATRMPWDRVSQWEIEERRGGVLLTLRGDGASTPLVVPGWSLEDLEAVLRTAAGSATTATPATPATPASATPAPPARPEGEPGGSAAVESPSGGTAGQASADPSRLERRRRIRARSSPAPSWKVVATVVLLGLLASAVTLVLLQSAGVISWGFLGPTA